MAASPNSLQFDVLAGGLDVMLTDLRKLDRDLYNQMRREFRAELKPLANKLQKNIPRGGSPLSGMSRSPRISRSLQSAEDRAPFVWKLPTARVEIGTRRRGRRGVRNVVRIRFNDKRPYSAFSVLELARNSFGYRGANMVRGINAKYAPVGKGRWVIQQFYDRRPEVIGVLKMFLKRYGVQVSARLAAKAGKSGVKSLTKGIAIGRMF